jgi:GNAT superfamily N-acetyltransferase
MLKIEARPFDRWHASEHEMQALHTFTNIIRSEQWPDDPPLSLEEVARNLRAIPPFVEMHLWAVWRDNKIVAYSDVAFLKTDENQHIAEFEISVLPELRRKGIAKQLLEVIASATESAKRTLLVTSTDAMIPAAEAFMKRIGASLGITSGVNQLKIVDLDRNLLQKWIAQGEKNSSEFELGFWEGPYPEEELLAVVKMKELMNTAPRGELKVDDFHFTPEHLRQIEAAQAKRGAIRWTFYVRDRKTRDFAGYTETMWNPSKPETVNQGDTAVAPPYRNHGLGRWLKATMIEKILHERPQIKHIRTGNADSNAPMLKINHELGFKLYKSWNVWQVELSKVKEYLSR